MTFYNFFGSILVLRVRKNQIKNSNEREKMITEISDNPVVSRLAREYVVSFLHFTGENRNYISDAVNANVRYQYANGFGNLSESNHDVETIKDMLWDWSHVRDSSDESFLAMAMEIDKWVSTEDKSSDSMLDFKIFVANYFQDLRREFDYYVNMEPDATSEIDRIDEELYYETQI